MWSLRFFSLHVLVCLAFVNLTHCFDVNLTSQEAIEFHSLFKRYNKPAVKEIKTIYGDTYKCVNFYEQPAFDHPLLKNIVNHQKMNISALHEQSTRLYKKSQFNGLWTTGEGCPTGTIPMRKYTKDEFIHMQKLLQILYPTDDPLPGRFRSSVHTKNEPLTFYGASAYLDVYNFPIDRTQYTASYTLIRRGNDQLQTGWMINPILNGDGSSRIFVTTTINRSKCFNLLCGGGYVHLNKDIPIDTVLDATERGGSITKEIKPAILRNKTNNRWELWVSSNQLGYWPTEKLTDLKGAAEYLEWGGEAYNPVDKSLNGPGMGSGFFPTGSPKSDGYARQIATYDEDGESRAMHTHELESYADDSTLYKIQDRDYVNNDYGHLAFFGGPGKQN